MRTPGDIDYKTLWIKQPTIEQANYKEGGKMATPGTSFKELIKYATSKEGATREDFESAMSARGYKPGEVRKLGNAFDRVSTSGNEYVLHPTKGFNVFGTDNTQKTGSGRKKGNKAGSDLGDLIGLGNDVSLLAGALRHESVGYEKSKVASQKVITPEHPVQKTPEVQFTSGPSTTTRIKEPSTTRPGTSKGVSKAPTAGQPNVSLKAPEEEKSNGPKTFSWDDITSKFGDLSGAPAKAGEEGTDWSRLLFGDLPNLWDPEHWKYKAMQSDPRRLWDPKVAKEFEAIEKSHWEKQNPGGDFNTRQMGGEPFPNLGVLSGLRNYAPGSLKSTMGSMERELLRNTKALKPVQQLVHTPTPEAVESNFLDNLTEDFGHVQAKGGKMQLYDNGGQFPRYTTPTFEEDNRGWEDYYNPGPVATQEESSISSTGQYGERDPSSGTGEQGHIGGDVLAGLVKYGIPAAYLGAEQHQINHLRHMINPHLVAPELMVGAVQDLPRPDFSLPYDPGMGGSSLTEAHNSGLARDEFARRSRNEWEMNNASSRLQQHNAIIDRLNQQAQVKAGITNQGELIKANNAMQEMGYLLQDRGQTAGSLFNNLDQGIYGAQVSKDARNLSQAQEIVRNPDRYPSKADQDWARQVLGSRRKNGGKLRFSKAAAY